MGKGAQADAQAGASIRPILSDAWKVFVGLSREDPILSKDALSLVPDEIVVGGRRIEAQVVRVPDGRLDFGPLLGGAAEGKTAYVFTSLNVEEAGEALLGFGADWWLQAWLDGKPVADTFPDGNPVDVPSKYNVIVSPTLSKGKHVLAVRFVSGSVSSRFAMGALDALGMRRGPELTWKPHESRVGDGKGGWTHRDVEFRFLHGENVSNLLPYGMTQMDNGEVILLAMWEQYPWSARSVPVAAFSKDRGDTWSDWQLIPGALGNPVMTADLGNGNVTFISGSTVGTRRFYSHDYGRTWPDRIAVPTKVEGGQWGVEGNPLVERDAASGNVTLAEAGYNWPVDGGTGGDPSICHLRWSRDGGRTWTDQSSPREWVREETLDGKTYRIGTSEGSLVRANNGWLIASLRTGPPAWWLTRSGCDNYAGLGFSVSKDDGKTWSPVKVVHPAGRQHAHFVKMRNGDLAMIYVMRQDVGPDGIHYASYARGCAALVSRDNGLTWDVSREYRLHEFDFAGTVSGILTYACGHTCSTLLDDGSILTAYGHAVSKGIALIRWKP